MLSYVKENPWSAPRGRYRPEKGEGRMRLRALHICLGSKKEGKKKRKRKNPTTGGRGGEFSTSLLLAGARYASCFARGRKNHRGRERKSYVGFRRIKKKINRDPPSLGKLTYPPWSIEKKIKNPPVGEEKEGGFERAPSAGGTLRVRVAKEKKNK